MNAATRRLWAWPLALGLLTASGLVSALVSDAWGDAWAWLALSLTLLVAAACVVMPGPCSAPRPDGAER